MVDRQPTELHVWRPVVVYRRRAMPQRMLSPVDLSERQANAARHPWELARGKFFRGLITAELTMHDGSVDILDLGSGDSWFAAQLIAGLPAGSEITCWDLNFSDADLAAPSVTGLIRTTECPSGVFDAIVMLDVLEHISDDASFFRETVMTLLRPGGRLVFSVPAHQWLFSRHDTALGHCRRYRPKDAAAILGEYLTIDQEGSLFSSLLLLRAVELLPEKVLRFRRPPTTTPYAGVGGWTSGPTVTRAVTALLSTDAQAGLYASSRGVRLPGLSYWAVCTKPMRIQP